MKSALLEREIGESARALELLDEGIAKYPAFAKLYMMAGQVCMEERDKLQGSGPAQGQDGGTSSTSAIGAAAAYAVRARDYYQKGLKENPVCVPLWLLVIRLEETVRGATKARSMTELARIKVLIPFIAFPLLLPLIHYLSSHSFPPSPLYPLPTH